MQVNLHIYIRAIGQSERINIIVAKHIVYVYMLHIYELTKTFSLRASKDFQVPNNMQFCIECRFTCIQVIANSPRSLVDKTFSELTHFSRKFTHLFQC